MRRRVALKFALLMCSALATGAHCAPSAAELERIEGLIAFVEGHKDLRFERNGKAYTAVEAGRFLRAKFASMGGQVGTAQQFVEQIASKSSTSGKPYQVVLPDGRRLSARQFLADELARIDRRS